MSAAEQKGRLGEVWLMARTPLAKWRADVARHQEDAKLQRLAGLVKLVNVMSSENDDSQSFFCVRLVK